MISNTQSTTEVIIREKNEEEEGWGGRDKKKKMTLLNRTNPTSSPWCLVNAMKTKIRKGQRSD